MIPRMNLLQTKRATLCRQVVQFMARIQGKKWQVVARWPLEVKELLKVTARPKGAAAWPFSPLRPGQL